MTGRSFVDVLQCLPGCRFFLDEHLLSLKHRGDLDFYWQQFKELDRGKSEGVLGPKDRKRNLIGSNNIWLKTTSGTSGEVRTAVYDESFYFRQLFLPLLQFYWRAGLNPDASCLVLCINNSETNRSYVAKDPLNWLLAAATINIDERDLTAFSYVRNLIDRIRPDVIISKPPLFEAMLATGVLDAKMSARFLVSGGCQLTESLYLDLRERTHRLVLNCYACSEYSALGISCFKHSGLHVCAESIKIDIDTKRYHSGEIMVSYCGEPDEKKTPFRTGDSGRLVTIPCSCGSVFPRLTEIEGKLLPIFVTALGSYYDPSRLHKLLNSEFGIAEFSATQIRGGEIDLRVPQSLAERFTVDAIAAAVRRSFDGAVFISPLRSLLRPIRRFARDSMVHSY